MSSRVNSIYKQADCSERSYLREEKYGLYQSPYRQIEDQSVEFSFKQISQSGQQILQRQSSLYKSQSLCSLKQNLQQLPKSEIIQLLIQQINLSQADPSQRQRLNETLKDINKNKNTNSTKKEDPNYKKKYDQLVKDFQEYINNTRQAQQHYVKIIQDLKKQNKNLETHLNKKSKESQHSQIYSPRSYQKPSTQMVEKLQQTIQNYVKINNELIAKVQKIERLNKETILEMAKCKQDNKSFQEENQFLIKENQKLEKQNQSFKSIVNELKDYIMERREAKDQGPDNPDTKRSNVSRNTQNQQGDKKYEIGRCTQDDSFIESSEIKKRQQTLNDSTIMFQKDSNLAINIQFQNKVQRKYQQTQSADYSKITENLRILQKQNKELKTMNQKLQKLLGKKSQKINILLQEIQTLTTETNIANQKIIELKCKIKKNNVYSHNQSTLASKWVNQDLKSSLGKDQMNIKNYSRLKDSFNEGFIKHYSHCFESQFKKPNENLDDDQFQEQNRFEQNRHKKTFNLESFNMIKGHTQNKTSQKENQLQRSSSQQYYIPKTLIVSNKKF